MFIQTQQLNMLVHIKINYYLLKNVLEYKKICFYSNSKQILSDRFPYNTSIYSLVTKKYSQKNLKHYWFKLLWSREKSQFTIRKQSNKFM